MNSTVKKNKPPFSQRFLIFFLSVLFGLLVYWLLGFILQDIGNAPGPQLQDIEAHYVDKNLTQENNNLQDQLKILEQKIEEQRDRQALIQTSMQNAQNTIRQFLDIQNMAAKKNEPNQTLDLSAYNESLQLFQADQKRFQSINETISNLNEQSNQLRAKQQNLQKELNLQRDAASTDYQRRVYHHNMLMGAIKIALLIPLLLIAGYFFTRHRQSLYAPLIYAASIALLVKLFMIIHTYFPSRLFKYIIILILLYVVVRALIQALRRAASPKMAYLLKQYREAYARFLCPVCEYPIQRGPLKYSFWSRNNVQRLLVTPSRGQWGPEEKYSCPACGTRLYAACESCGDMRHCLLPYCEKCGAENKEINTV